MLKLIRGNIWDFRRKEIYLLIMLLQCIDVQNVNQVLIHRGKNIHWRQMTPVTIWRLLLLLKLYWAQLQESHWNITLDLLKVKEKNLTFIPTNFALFVVEHISNVPSLFNYLSFYFCNAKNNNSNKSLLT